MSNTCLLKGYSIEIFNSKCQPGAMGVHCFAHFEQNVGQVIPYLNALLGGIDYIPDPPALTLRSQGKLITIHEDKAAINALKDEAEARKIVEWLKNEINSAWARKDEITPDFRRRSKPKLLEILKLLPKTNCGQCGQPTCMVFATQVMEGGHNAEHCPGILPADKEKLACYLDAFVFD